MSDAVSNAPPGVRESDGAVSADPKPSTRQNEPQQVARSGLRAPWHFALRRLARHKGPFALALFWSGVFILVPMQVPVITGALINSLRSKHTRLYGVSLEPAG